MCVCTHAQSCPTPYNAMDSSVHGILQARIWEWVAIPFPRGSSGPRDQTHILCVSCTDKWILYHLSHQGSPWVQCVCESHSVVSDSLRLYSPWDSPGQNTGVSSRSLLQGIFPSQGSNPGLLHCRWVQCTMKIKRKMELGGQQGELSSTHSVNTDPNRKRLTLHLLQKRYYLTTTRRRTIFLLAWQQFNQWETVTTQTKKTLYILNSQFPPINFLFITNPPNFPFSFIKSFLSLALPNLHAICYSCMSCILCCPQIKPFCW